MFGIGFGEFAIIFVVLIVAVGPEKLPTFMKTVGKTIRGLRQASRDIRSAVGIDELLREDIDLSTPRPVRKPAPAAGQPVSRGGQVAPTAGGAEQPAAPTPRAAIEQANAAPASEPALAPTAVAGTAPAASGMARPASGAPVARGAGSPAPAPSPSPAGPAVDSESGK